ncbi:MAG: hypothetical protein ACD_62C00387G0003, partial [uncultured bacterium]
MTNQSFSECLLSTENHQAFITTAQDVRRSIGVPEVLRDPIRNPELENWFVSEAKQRLASLPANAVGQQRQDLLESPNRYPDGSMRPISLAELNQMTRLCGSAGDILNRASQGRELLTNNDRHPLYGTAARGVP